MRMIIFLSLLSLMSCDGVNLNFGNTQNDDNSEKKVHTTKDIEIVKATNNTNNVSPQKLLSKAVSHVNKWHTELVNLKGDLSKTQSVYENNVENIREYSTCFGVDFSGLIFKSFLLDKETCLLMDLYKAKVGDIERKLDVRLWEITMGMMSSRLPFMKYSEIKSYNVIEESPSRIIADIVFLKAFSTEDQEANTKVIFCREGEGWRIANGDKWNFSDKDKRGAKDLENLINELTNKMQELRQKIERRECTTSKEVWQQLEKINVWKMTMMTKINEKYGN